MDPGYITYGCTELACGDTTYAFDFDGTIIKPTGAKWTDSWTLNPPVCELLRQIRKLLPVETPIVVFTNQAGVANGNVSTARLFAKLDAVFGAIFGFTADKMSPVYTPTTFIALSSQYRKPSPCMYQEYLAQFAPAVNRGYFIGDATDPIDDFSDSDYKFALNCRLGHINVAAITTVTNCANVAELNLILSSKIYEGPVDVWLPRTIFDNAADQPPGCIADLFARIHSSDIVILVGPPGCGKSTLAKQIVATTGALILSRDIGDTATRSNITTAKLQKQFLRLIADNPNTPVVVDATHPDVSSRSYYLANKCGRRVIAVVITISTNSAQHLNGIRAFKGGPKVPSVVYSVFAKKYALPTIVEGFDAVITIDKLWYDPALTDDEHLRLFV